MFPQRVFRVLAARFWRKGLPGSFPCNPHQVLSASTTCFEGRVGTLPSNSRYGRREWRGLGTSLSPAGSRFLEGCSQEKGRNRSGGENEGDSDVNLG